MHRVSSHFAATSWLRSIRQLPGAVPIASPFCRFGASITIEDEDLIKDISITPTWSDHFVCEAESEGDAEEVVAVAVDEEGGQVDVKSRKEATKLSIQLPQKVHLSVRTVLGNIRVFDKIEGDIVLASERGNITANKLRGEVVDVAANTGAIDIEDVVEGRSISMKGARVTVGRIFADQAHIEGVSGNGENSKVLIESCYSKLLSIASKVPTFIDSAHGEVRAKIDADVPFVLNGFNGNAVAECTGSIMAHFHHCQGISRFNSEKDVAVTFQPPANVDLHVEAQSGDLCTDIEGVDEGNRAWEGCFQTLASRLRAEDPDEVLRKSKGTQGKISTEGRQKAGFERAVLDRSQEGSSDQDPPEGTVHIHAKGKATVSLLTWVEMVRRRVRLGMQSGKFGELSEKSKPL